VVEASITTGEDAPVLDLKTTAGPDGRFSLPQAPAKWTGLLLRARRGPLAVEADLRDARGPLDIDIRLPETFRAAGLVISEEEGRGLEGMVVRIGGLEARTDAFGRFAFPDLPAALAGGEPPEIEVTGAGRRPLRRALPLDRGVDDLLLRVEAE
jgi:hypothetical protein